MTTSTASSSAVHAPLHPDGTAQSAAMNRVFRQQHQFLPDLAARSARERIARLRKLQKALMAHQDRLRAAMMADFRKHPTEVDLTEIFPVSAEIKHTCAHLADWMKPDAAETPLAMIGSRAEIRYQPRGVCLIISPWNFPINLTLIPLVSAIASGNAVMIKTSELAPRSSQAIADLLHEVFEEREVYVFQGDASVARALLELPFHHIFFTGSPAVGKLVMKAAAEHLSSVTLELGGKSPVLIEESANLEEATRRIAWGKYINNGQVCLSPDYALVPERLADAFLSQMQQQIEAFFGKSEEARKHNTSYARIINERHFLRIKGLVDDALAKGARVHCGAVYEQEQRYIAPTLLSDLTDDMNILQEEIFGPVLPVLFYSDWEDAIAYINAKPRPLALYLYSSNETRIDDVLNRTTSGSACVNDNIVQFFNPNIPFGGVNNSGMGQNHGIFGFRSFSHAKGVVYQNKRLSATKLMYPPYTDQVGRLVDWTIKLF